MRIGIVCLTFNNLQYTKECLRTYFKYTPRNICDLVVLDNGSSDDTPGFLLSQDCFTIIKDSNNGLSAPRNEATKYLLDKGIYDYICYIHNDMVFTSNWLTDSINVLNSLPCKSVLGIANIVSTDYLTLSDTEREYIASFSKTKTIAFANLEPRFHPVGLFKDIGFFDEAYKQSEAEDIDYNIRTFNAGYTLTATNRAVVFHVVALTRLTVPHSTPVREFNYNYCIIKYGKDTFNKFNYVRRDSFFVDGIPYTRYGC